MAAGWSMVGHHGMELAPERSRHWHWSVSGQLSQVREAQPVRVNIVEQLHTGAEQE